MRKCLFIIALFLYIPKIFALDFTQSLQIKFGPEKQTGFKGTQMGIESDYFISTTYAEGKAGLSFNCESLNLSLSAKGKYELKREYVCLGVAAGFLYHDLFMFDVFLDQDFLLIWNGYVGCPKTKTKVCVSSYFGYKCTSVFAIMDSDPFLVDYFENYDFCIEQEILKTKWQLGFATFSFLRHDLRFIPEIYLNGKYFFTDNFMILAESKIMFSDMSNKSCHPEYFFIKGGVEWRF